MPSELAWTRGREQVTAKAGIHGPAGQKIRFELGSQQPDTNEQLDLSGGCLARNKKLLLRAERLRAPREP